LHTFTVCLGGTRRALRFLSIRDASGVARGLPCASFVMLVTHRAALVAFLVFSVFSVFSAFSSSAQADEPRSYAEAARRTRVRDTRRYGAVSVWVEAGAHEVSSPYGSVSPMERRWLAVDAHGGRVTVRRPGDATHTIRLDLETDDLLRTTIDDASTRREGALAATLTAITVTAATSAVLGELACEPDAGPCDRRTWIGVLGGIAGGLQLVAGILLGSQSDGLDVERHRDARVRRFHPHARGFTVTPALFHGLAAGLTLGVIPFLALQTPSIDVEGPWDALGPGMVAMLATPFLVAMAGELGGGRGQLWAAVVGLDRRWLVGHGHRPARRGGDGRSFERTAWSDRREHALRGRRHPRLCPQRRHRPSVTIRAPPRPSP
jgi:hypothetical protein